MYVHGFGKRRERFAPSGNWLFGKIVRKVADRTYVVDIGGMEVKRHTDDILVSGKDDAEHLENLSRVFEKLTELGLTLKTSKCNFFQSSIEYVGFILNEHGISANPEKIRAVP